MKNQKNIFRALIGLAILLSVYFIFKSKGSQDLSAYIPKDALFVAKIDLKSMGQKMKFNELAEFKSFKKIMKELKSDSRSTIEKTFENPLESGISFLQSPCIFAFNTSKDDAKPILCISFGITDKEKFSKSFENITNGDFDLKKGESFTSVRFDREASLFFNDKVAFILGGVSEDEVSFKKIAEGFLEFKKEESILSNENYNNFQKNEYDLNLFVNRKAIEKIVDLSHSRMNNDERLAFDGFLSSSPLGVTLAFNDDVIKLKSIADPDFKENSFFKSTGLKEESLKFLSPNGKPLGFMAFNLDLIKLFKRLGSSSDKFSSAIDEFSSKIGVSTRNLLDVFNGDLSISFLDVVSMPAYNPYTSYSVTDSVGIGVDPYSDNTYAYPSVTEPVPIFVAYASISNTSSFDQIINNAGSELQNENGIYYPASSNSNRSVYFARKGNGLLVSNNKPYLEDFVNGNLNWKPLVEESGNEISKSNPFSFYFDLRYSSYNVLFENQLRQEMSRSEGEMAKVVMKNLKSFTASYNNDAVSMELTMDTQNINSLWRIFMIVEDVYKTIL